MKTYCILLEKDENRKKNVYNNISPHLDTENFEIIEAIDGNTKTLDTEMISRTVSGNFFNFCKRGQLACFLSHVKTWQKMIDEDIQSAIILEDDASISKNFIQEFVEILNLAPSADFIYLFVHPDSLLKLDIQVTGEKILKGFSTYGTVGYYITLNLVKKILRETDNFKNISSPIDDFLSDYLEKNNANYYCVRNNIVNTIGNLYQDSHINSLGSLIGNTDLYKYDKMEEGILMLNMIVKNEEKIITRCLDSLKDFIDGVVICDTGSTDNTIKIIEEWMTENDKIGYVFSSDWVNFEYNRNLALQKCKEWMDENLFKVSEDGNLFFHRICFMDADDYIVVRDKQNFIDSLNYIKGEVWYLDMNYDGVTYSRLFMVKHDIPSKWEGVLHEYLSCPANNHVKINSAAIVVNRDGDRNKDSTKYLKDALVLEKALSENPNNSRNVFYLAQSYRDYGFYKKAEEIYLDRFEMEGHDEERYLSLLEAAKCRIYRDKNDHKVSNLLMKAMGFRPHRLEAPYYLIKKYRNTKLEYMGYILGKYYLEKLENGELIKADSLFIDTDIYSWKFFDELSICAFFAGDKNMARFLINKILERNIPEKDRERITSNLSYF